jgi:hypothetical protein
VRACAGPADEVRGTAGCGPAPVIDLGEDGVMSDVYLNVGPVKTGSTYPQSVLWNSRDD